MWPLVGKLSLQHAFWTFWGHKHVKILLQYETLVGLFKVPIWYFILNCAYITFQLWIQPKYVEKFVSDLMQQLIQFNWIQLSLKISLGNSFRVFGAYERGNLKLKLMEE